MIKPFRAHLFWSLLLLSAACRNGARSGTPAPRTSCIVAAPSAASPALLSIATAAPVSAAHAPNPTNSAERFVFAQGYETLINVDCDGRAYPGLARTWTTDASKTRITFTLRDGAHFWNGEPVTPGDIVTAWRATANASSDSGHAARRLAEATTIVDDRTLTVSLPDTEWLVLADPSLSVYRPAARSTWPIGSGPYRIGESATDVAPGGLTLISQSGQATVRLAIRSSPDARDAIDAGVDLLLAADAITVSYVTARPDLTTIPLPWSRTYALALPGGTPAAAITDMLSPAGDSAAAFRASLARDAVRADARAADADSWVDIQDCKSSGSLTRRGDLAGPSQRRIVYRSDDHVARELAARLVAVGQRGTAFPLGPADFARALRTGNELAYVVDLPHTSLARCRDVASLMASAPWLSGSGAADGVLIPLIDTRERAIAKRDRISARIDWDGTLRLNAAAAWGTTP